MRMLAIMTLILTSSGFSYANEKTYEKEIFKGKFTKQGDSFVCSVAYRKAVNKAWDEGFGNCSLSYEYDLSTSWFDDNEYTCKAYVECKKNVYVKTQENGKNEIEN